MKSGKHQISKAYPEMILFAPKLILTNVYALPSVQATGDQCCT